MTSHHQQQQSSSSSPPPSSQVDPSTLLERGNFGYTIEQLRQKSSQLQGKKQQQQSRRHDKAGDVFFDTSTTTWSGDSIAQHFNSVDAHKLIPERDTREQEFQYAFHAAESTLAAEKSNLQHSLRNTANTKPKTVNKVAAAPNICHHLNYCDPNIFNPFRKKSHELDTTTRGSKSKSDIHSLSDNRQSQHPSATAAADKMKYDYRREREIHLDASKNTVKHASNYKNTYLFLYNLLMFVMFLMVWMILVIKVLTGSMDDESVQGAALIVKLLTYTQLLESIHPILGLVPGGPFMPFLQVIGRLLVNYFLTDPDIRTSSAPYAHSLFIVWSSIEIFRYSFYALRVFNVEIYPITWCRYTLFMPLYPMGGFCESQIVLATARHYEKTGAFSYSLPNSLNISFNLPLSLKFYTFALLGPSIFYLMRYMWSQRCKQLKVKVA